MSELGSVLEDLVDEGWYCKIAPDTGGPRRAWKCWLRWPQGELPHREESTKCSDLDAASKWFRETADNWPEEE